jgi:hypothetical protein
MAAIAVKTRLLKKGDRTAPRVLQSPKAVSDDHREVASAAVCRSSQLQLLPRPTQATYRVVVSFHLIDRIHQPGAPYGFCELHIFNAWHAHMRPRAPALGSCPPQRASHLVAFPRGWTSRQLTLARLVDSTAREHAGNSSGKRVWRSANAGYCNLHRCSLSCTFPGSAGDAALGGVGGLAINCIACAPAEFSSVSTARSRSSR